MHPMQVIKKKLADVTVSKKRLVENAALGTSRLPIVIIRGV